MYFCHSIPQVTHSTVKSYLYPSPSSGSEGLILTPFQEIILNNRSNSSVSISLLYLKISDICHSFVAKNARMTSVDVY